MERVQGATGIQRSDAARLGEFNKFGQHGGVEFAPVRPNARSFAAQAQDRIPDEFLRWLSLQGVFLNRYLGLLLATAMSQKEVENAVRSRGRSQKTD